MVTIKKNSTATRMPGDKPRYGHSPTPGPWEVNSGMVQTVSGIPIAHMDRAPGNGTRPCERDSNAYLIAASPRLLAACKALLKAYAPNADFSKPSELHSAVLLAGQAIADVNRYNAS